MATKSTIAAQIASLLADNSNGDISAADLRTVVTALLDNTPNLTDDLIAQAEAEAGTATTPRLWTAQRVAQAISALAAGGGGAGDMLKSTYDSDDDGVVDLAAAIEGIAAAAASQYYGKDAGGTVGFFDLPSASATVSTAGTVVTLDLTAGRQFGTIDTPLTSFTLDLSSAVDLGIAEVIYQGANDPFAGLPASVQKWGYNFEPNRLQIFVFEFRDGTNPIVRAFSSEAQVLQPVLTNVRIEDGAQNNATSPVHGTLYSIEADYSQGQGFPEDTSNAQYEWYVDSQANLSDVDFLNPISTAQNYSLGAGTENSYLRVRKRAAVTVNGSTTLSAWAESGILGPIAAPSGWIPTDLGTKLLAWWDFTDDLYRVSGTDATKIQTLIDRSGNGYDIEQTNTGFQAVKQTGYASNPGIAFNYSTGSLPAATVITSANEWKAWASIQQDSAPGDGTDIMIHASNGILEMNADGSVDVPTAASSAGVLPTGQYNVVGLERTSNLKVSVDAIQVIDVVDNSRFLGGIGQNPALRLNTLNRVKHWIITENTLTAQEESNLLNYMKV